MSLTLHRVIIPSNDDEAAEQLFIFSLDGANSLYRDVKNIESNEFNFEGNTWSLICAKKEDSVGLFIKWKYADSSTAKETSVKTKFALTFVHQSKSHLNISFVSSTQKFSSAQLLLGKSKMISVDELLKPVTGFLDETGKMLMIEVRMIGSAVRYESVVDVSPKCRTRKNASGVYFDSNLFYLANQRWFIRFYISKINSNGLPAVYLYLHDGSPGITTQLRFTLFMGKECTEILDYDFGEGAKFDGFGKTLLEPFLSPEKLIEINVACEITKQKVYKFVPVRIFSMISNRSLASNTPIRKSPISFGNSLSREKLKLNKLSPFDSSNQVFQDHYGNPWKIEISKDIYSHNFVTFLFDKGIYHYPNNRSIIACIQAYIMSNDLNIANDTPMSVDSPIVGYFSNFTDDKGSLINFQLNLALLSDLKGGYLNENNEVTIRVDFVSVQSTPFSIRSGPKYDLYIKHLLKSRQEMDDGLKKENNLKEMSASRASLSILEERPPSGSSYSSGLGLPNTKNEGFEITRSIDSLNSISNGRTSPNVNKKLIEETNKSTITILQEYLNNIAVCGDNISTNYRDAKHMNGLIEISDNKNIRARPMDETRLIKESKCDEALESKHLEIVTKLIDFLKRTIQLSISEIVTIGSLGTQTSTASRSDIDIVLYCKDLPHVKYQRWLPALLKTLKNTISQSLSQLRTTTSIMDELNCSSLQVADHSIQFTINSQLDVDVMLASDWSNDLLHPSRNDSQLIRHVFDASTENASEFDARCLDLSCSHLRKILIDELKPEIKDYIKVVKHWRNGITWIKHSYRPDSYLILLLVIRAAEICEKKGPSLSEVLVMLGNLLKEPELIISWNWFYEPTDFASLKFDPPTPMILDPVNPSVNVALRLKYWGQFKTEYLKWLSELEIVF